MPLPVVVQGGVPDWVAYVVLGVSIATLIGVGVQIFLARNEINYVKQDLENQLEQMEEFRRRPQLQVEFKPKEPVTQPGRQTAVFHVVNRGTATSKGFRVRFWMPKGSVDHSPSAEVGGRAYHTHSFIPVPWCTYPTPFSTFLEISQR